MNEFTDCSLLLVKNYSSATVYITTFVKRNCLLELPLSVQKSQCAKGIALDFGRDHPHQGGCAGQGITWLLEIHE